MKKNHEIMVIEKSENFSLDFNLPIAQFNEEALATLYGGAAAAGCPCRRGTTGFWCDCYGGGVLKPTASSQS